MQKRYAGRNETRPIGSHCIDGSSGGGGSSGTGSKIVLEQGSYQGDNLTTSFCQVDQTVDPETPNAVMTGINVGWCGATFSDKFTCSTSDCKGGSTKFDIKALSPTKYVFTMPSASSVFTKVSGSKSPGTGSAVTLKSGKYKGSNLTVSFCPDRQITDPVIRNGVMTQVKFGRCGSANSATFDCQGKTCAGSGFTVQIINANRYTFTVKTDTATYDWESSSLTP